MIATTAQGTALPTFHVTPSTSVPQLRAWLLGGHAYRSVNVHTTPGTGNGTGRGTLVLTMLGRAPRLDPKKCIIYPLHGPAAKDGYRIGPVTLLRIASDCRRIDP